MSVDPVSFTRTWIAAWNRRDVEAVLAHYAETVVFASPKAASFVGRTELHGKNELRHYWQTASAGIDSLVFTFDRVLWDPLQRVLSMIYIASFNGVSGRAIEIVEFDADGLIRRGEAMYGAMLAADTSSVDA
jgi:hypothetical protein